MYSLFTFKIISGITDDTVVLVVVVVVVVIVDFVVDGVVAFDVVFDVDGVVFGVVGAGCLLQPVSAPTIRHPNPKSANPVLIANSPV